MAAPVPHDQARTLDVIRRAIVEPDRETRADLLRQAAWWLDLSRRAAKARFTNPATGRRPLPSSSSDTKKGRAIPHGPEGFLGGKRPEGACAVAHP
jgi:hypothetical protein